MTDRNRLYTVSELARAFDLTPQGLRFYEEKGLLSPRRIGGARVFDYRDRARLDLILRFRRVGFSLEEIREYLSLYRPGNESSEQYRLGLLRIHTRQEALRLRLADIHEILNELAEMEKDAQSRLERCLAAEAGLAPATAPFAITIPETPAAQAQTSPAPASTKNTVPIVHNGREDQCVDS